MTTPPMPRALSRFKVLDLSRVRSGPNCVRVLADFGADVLRIEPPAGVDPNEVLFAANRGGGDFQNLNRNKRSLTLNLKKPGALDILMRLVAQADVLVENTKPGTLPRHGFTPEEILRINPNIIYCAISGYGEDSPYRGLGGMDTTIQGMSGIMALTRVNDVPYKTGISIADLHAGQFALVAVLSAGQEALLDLDNYENARCETVLRGSGGR